MLVVFIASHEPLFRWLIPRLISYLPHWSGPQPLTARTHFSFNGSHFSTLTSKLFLCIGLIWCCEHDQSFSALITHRFSLLTLPPACLSSFFFFLSSPVSLLTIPFFTFSAAPFGECAGEEDKTWKRWRAVSLPWLEQHWLHSYLFTIYQPFLKHSRSFCVCVFVCVHLCRDCKSLLKKHIFVYVSNWLVGSAGKDKDSKTVTESYKWEEMSSNFFFFFLWNLRLQIAPLTLSWLHIRCQASQWYFICLHWQGQQVGSLAFSHCYSQVHTLGPRLALYVNSRFLCKTSSLFRYSGARPASIFSLLTPPSFGRKTHPLELSFFTSNWRCVQQKGHRVRGKN